MCYKLTPYLERWCDDIGETENGFLVIENNDKHRLFISSDVKMVRGKDSISGHACYISVTDEGKYIMFNFYNFN